MLHIVRVLMFCLALVPTCFAQNSSVVDLEQLNLPPSVAAAVDPSARIGLGSDQRRGITASAWLEKQPLLDLSEPLADGLQHFLLQVRFVEQKSAELQLEGLVAVKVFGPEGKAAEPVRLETVDEGFQGSLILGDRGEYLLKIGSKLTDDKKRIYRFFYDRQLLEKTVELPQEEGMLGTGSRPEGEAAAADRAPPTVQ